MDCTCLLNPIKRPHLADGDTDIMRQVLHYQTAVVQSASFALYELSAVSLLMKLAFFFSSNINKSVGAIELGEILGESSAVEELRIICRRTEGSFYFTGGSRSLFWGNRHVLRIILSLKIAHVFSG